MEEKILEKYSVIAENVSAEVEIKRVPGELVPIYELKLPEIGKGTEALINKIRERLIVEIPVKTAELLDITAIESLKKRFETKGLEMIRKELPRVKEETARYLVGLLIHEMLGLGILEMPLADPNLEEVVVNTSTEPTWVYHKKFGWLKTTIRIPTEGDILNFASIIGRRVGRQITILNPLMDAHLTTGDRVNSTLFPISTKGNTLTLRKFRRAPWTITDFIQNKTLNLEVASWVWLAVQYELNMIVSGGTASGKTSLLNVFMSFIPPNHRVVSIEDTRELQLANFLHWVPLTTRGPNPEGKGEVCMFPGSYFIDGKGELHEISEFIENLIRQNGTKKIKENVEVVDGNGFSILAGDPINLSYREEKVKYFSKITGSKFICEIVCEDGTTLRITENTRLPVLKDGEIRLLKPKEIEEGKSFLFIFPKLSFNGSIQRINIFNIFNEGNFYACGIKDFWLQLECELRKKYTLNELAKICNLKRQSFNWYRKVGIARISVLKKLLELSTKYNIEEVERKIKFIKSKGGSGHHVKIPRQVDKDLAYLMGFILAEKWIGKNSILISQAKRLPFLKQLIKKLFGTDVIIRKGKYYRYLLFSSAITHLMKNLFSVTHSKHVRVPPIIMRSPDEVIASFLAGYIDGDGVISRGKVSLATSSEKAVQEFKYLFLKLGIFSRVRRDKKVFSIDICRRKDVVKACSLLPFKLKKNREKAKLNLEYKFGEPIRGDRIPYQLVAKHIVKLKNFLNKSERYKYFYRYKENKTDTISRERLNSLYNLLAQRVNTIPEEVKSLEELSKIIRSNVEFVRIKEVKLIENRENTPSYDITPEKSGYFVASGNGNFTLVQDTMLDLLVNSLRMRPDRIIVGEIRRASEAEVLFEAMHTGHSVYATVHADTAEQTYRRLVNPPISVPEIMLESLHLLTVCFRDRRLGIRRIFELAEIIPAGEAGRVGARINILYRWKPIKDVIEKENESYRLVEELRMHTGMSEKEIQADLKEKQDILNWLVKHNVNKVNAIGRLVSEYYINREEVLKAVKQNVKPEKLIPPEFLKD